MSLKYQDVSIIILFDEFQSPRMVEFGYRPTASKYGGSGGSGGGPSFFNLEFPSEQIELLKLSINLSSEIANRLGGG